MKRYFITGLVILLPLAVTIAIIVFLFNLLTEPFAGAISRILDHYDLLENDYVFATGHQVQFFISQLFILAFLFCFTVLLGKIASYFFVHYLLRFSDYLFKRIPLISSIYKSSQDVIQTLFTANSNSFKQVVLAPFPKEGVYSIGFVTQEDFKNFTEIPDQKMITIFIPTAPNPTSGFLMLYPRNEVVFLDMKPEDAFKYVISCGVVITPFNVTDGKKPELPDSAQEKLSNPPS